MGLHQNLNGSALPVILPVRFRQGSYFRAYWFTIATACQVARPPLTDLTGRYPSHEGFYIQAFSVSVSFLAAGYHYDSLWTFCRWDSHPLE